MKITEAQRNLSLYGGATAKRAEAVATELRSAAMIPKGGRGPYAPDATPEEVALLTLAVAGSNRIADAAETARALAETINENGASLLSVIAHAFKCAQDAHAIRHIRVMPNLPMAEVTYRTADRPDTCERFFAPGCWLDKSFVPEAQGQGYVGPIGHIGGAALDMMAIGFAKSSDNGEFIAE